MYWPHYVGHGEEGVIEDCRKEVRAPFEIDPTALLMLWALQIVRQLKVLDAALEGKDFLCGAKATIADFAFVPWTYNIPELFGAPEKSETFFTGKEPLGDVSDEARPQEYPQTQKLTLAEVRAKGRFSYPPFAPPTMQYPESKLLETEVKGLKNFMSWHGRLLEHECVKKMMSLRKEASAKSVAAL